MSRSADDTPLGRYLRTLEAVVAARGGIGLTDLARRLDLSPSTAHRLAAALVDHGLLQRTEDTRLYQAGRRLGALLHASMTAEDCERAAAPALSGLVAEFGETAHLARLAGDHAESVLMRRPQDSERAFVQPGRRLPLHAAASGKAILAYQDKAFIDRWMALPRERYTADTRVGARDIRRDLARVRRRGIAVCSNELDVGVLSYGHPVRAGTGPVLYSIGITGLARSLDRVPPERVRASLAQAASELAGRLGSMG